MRPPCRRREHRWRVAAQAALPAESLQKRQENEPLRSRSLRLAKHPHRWDEKVDPRSRMALSYQWKQGKKPATFNFLGLVHICARSRQGKFTVHVKTIAKRLARGLKAVWEWCKQRRYDPVIEQQKTLNAKLRGHYQYYGRRTNYRAIRQFSHRVRCIWREWLSRRTRAKTLTWERFAEIHTSAPAAATSDHTGSGESAESRLKNPLREICTVGSVRGKNSVAPGWTLNAHEAGNGGESQGKPTAH